MEKKEMMVALYNLRFSSDSSHLDFIAAKYGSRFEVKSSLNKGKIKVKETILDGWDVMRLLYKPRNPTPNKQCEQYLPVLVFIWPISRDIVSVGHIKIALCEWYLWLQTGRKRIYLGLILIT